MTQDPNRWQHLNVYERRYLQEAMQAYDNIMLQTQDIETIAQFYKLSIEDVQRAKDYAFGEGVSRYQFSPDPRMAEAWQRMGLNQGNKLDEVLLKHEIYESNLVVNQNYQPLEAHKLTQTKYPWSELIRQLKR